MAGYRKVLVLLDLSEGQRAGVHRRAAISRRIRTPRIVALHVVEYVPVEPMGEVADADDARSSRIWPKRARERLDELIASATARERSGGSKSATPRRRFCGSPRKSRRI